MTAQQPASRIRSARRGGRERQALSLTAAHDVEIPLATPGEDRSSTGHEKPTAVRPWRPPLTPSSDETDHEGRFSRRHRRIAGRADEALVSGRRLERDDRAAGGTAPGHGAAGVARGGGGEGPPRGGGGPRGGKCPAPRGGGPDP